MELSITAPGKEIQIKLSSKKGLIAQGRFTLLLISVAFA